MSLNILIVEGNPKSIWEDRIQYNLLPYHQRFVELLRQINPNIKTDIAFPSDENWEFLSQQKIQSYQGIMWTGGSLNVYNKTPPIMRQLAFADQCFESGVPIYGSCWGMQIASIVSGGEVSPCKKGREFGISDDIFLTPKGKASTFFKNKKSPFNALCIHEDEVSIKPKHAEVLAYNSHSEIQAMSLKYKNAEFLGVQYHPEFTLDDMIHITLMLKDKLIKEKLFHNEKALLTFVNQLQTANNLPSNIIDYSTHHLELTQWLSSLNK